MPDPVLNSVTLPCPVIDDGYEETTEYLFSEQRMADGSIVRDIVDAADKRTFFLKWNNLTPTDKGNIRTAWQAAFISDTGVPYTDLDSLGYTVIADSDIPRLSFRRMSTSSTLWTCEMRLREV